MGPCPHNIESKKKSARFWILCVPMHCSLMGTLFSTLYTLIIDGGREGCERRGAVREREKAESKCEKYFGRLYSL